MSVPAYRLSDFKSKITIKQIFKQHFHVFFATASHVIPESVRQQVFKVVTKMLECGDPEKGFAEYICGHCLESIKVAFTCKSKFCVSCSKIYIDNWVNRVIKIIFPVRHRHVIFTVPEELRPIFYTNRELLKDLSDCAAEVVLETIKERNKSLEIMAGVISVIHTFGRASNFNPHVHMLVTEGGLDRYKIWREVGYIPYEYLRKRWQYTLLNHLKSKLKMTREYRRLFGKLYKEKDDGFVILADRKVMNPKRAAKYIGRYLARPAIAEYRIIRYENDQVTYWYEDLETKKRETVTVSVRKFMVQLISHIPPKSFRMVRYYGLYAHKRRKKVHQILEVWELAKKRAKQMALDFVKSTKEAKASIKKTWRERIKESFGRDPLNCNKCKKEMFLWRIWHPDYGEIYSLCSDLKKLPLEKNELVEKDKKPVEDTQQVYQICLSFV